MKNVISLQILIPSYNRSKRLEKNITRLLLQIRTFNLQNDIGIIVSDNFSPDDTWERLQELKNNTKDIDFKIYRQLENIRLEPNALFVLEKATAPFVMYTGDDDYVDDKYLSRVIEIIKTDNNFTCAISGQIGMAPGKINRNVRVMPFDEHIYLPTLKNTSYLSHFFSQMSGLVYKREGMYKRYMENKELRNIYPFIFFGIYNASRGNTYFLAKYKAKITDFEEKDWGYDELGLIGDITKNFSILEPNDVLKRTILEISFCYFAMNRFLDAKKVGFIYFVTKIWKVKYMSLITKFFIINFSYYKGIKSKFS